MKSTERAFCNHRMPKIYCSLDVFFDIGKIQVIAADLRRNGFANLLLCNGRYIPEKENIRLSEVYYKEYWEIGDALTELFCQMPMDFDAVCDFIIKNGGDVYIEIAFEAYDVFPSLAFEGDVMEKIRRLKASIDIDPLFLGE